MKRVSRRCGMLMFDIHCDEEIEVKWKEELLINFLEIQPLGVITYLVGTERC